MKTTIYTSVTSELSKEWNSFWQARRDLATAFNSPLWLEAARHALGQADVRIITVRTNDGALKAVCALAKTRMYGVSVFTAPAAELADKPPILIDWTDKQAVGALYTELKKLGIVYLSYCAASVKESIEGGANTPIISFQDDLNAIADISINPYADLSPSVIKKANKRISKSEEPVTMHHSNQNNHIELLKTAVAIERESTKKARGMGVLVRTQIEAFFQYIALHKPELLDISVMKIGEKPVAFSVDFLAHNIFQGSQKAYLRGYEYYQPGKYLIMKLLEYHFEKGRTAFDFGRGYDSLKAQFISNPQPVYSVILAGQTAGHYLAFIKKLRDQAYNIVSSQKHLYKALKSSVGVIHV